MGLVPLRGFSPLSRRTRGLPQVRSRRRFRRSPGKHAIARAMLRHVGRVGVCPVHWLCDLRSPLARTPAIAGLHEVFDVKERRTLACLLSNECDAARSVTSAPVVGAVRLPSEVCAEILFPLRGERPWCWSRSSARGEPPLCQLLLVALRSIRRARLVTEGRLHGPEQSVSRYV